MPSGLTPNLGLTIPTVGGDNNQWGAELNTDLAIIDALGTSTSLPQGASFVATGSVTPETVYRVTTNGATVTVTLNASVIGKILTFKQVDGGAGKVVIVGTIDGQGSYVLAQQYQYVRLQWNGTTYDVIGNN